MGVRRACANEGVKLSQKMLADLFEQYIGTELVYHRYLSSPHIKIKYWRDSAGPEVDYVLERAQEFIPIEIKWSDKPNQSDAKHLKKFMAEYPTKQAFIICRTPQRYKITSHIIALPWQEVSSIFQ